MKRGYNIDVIIPALNEESAIKKVIADIPSFVREVIVVDNDSIDNTCEEADKAGATVVKASIRGYGNACLKGMNYIESKGVQPDILVFLDGDYADYPEEMNKLVQPIIEEDIDFVVGSRLEKAQQNSLTIPQRIGNKLATFLLRKLYNVKFTDLGPFRAIKWDKLLLLNMEDRNYGWTVEMQLKAAKYGLNCEEVSVNYRDRIGKSKVSGTIKGTVSAGYKILFTIFKYI